MVMLLVLFPNGQFIPRWTRWFVVFSTAWLLITSFHSLLVRRNARYSESEVFYVLVVVLRSMHRSIATGMSPTESTAADQVGDLRLHITLSLMMISGVPYIFVWNLPPGAALPWWYATVAPVGASP